MIRCTDQVRQLGHRVAEVTLKPVQGFGCQQDARLPGIIAHGMQHLGSAGVLAGLRFAPGKGGKGRVKRSANHRHAHRFGPVHDALQLIDRRRPHRRRLADGVRFRPHHRYARALQAKLLQVVTKRFIHRNRLIINEYLDPIVANRFQPLSHGVHFFGQRSRPDKEIKANG